jgi:hypothetical protein
MNRSWISKLSRAICPAIVGTLVLTAWASVQAAPLGRVYLEGRKQGDPAWSSSLIVAPNDVIEYRIRADLGDVGASNGSNTITSTANSGFQSLFLQIRQDASAPVQVNFRAPLADPNALASFKNGWADGTGASAGTLAPRAGGTNNDMLAIRPVHAAGQFTGVDPEDIVTGSTFQVMSVSGTTVLTPSWKPEAPNSGALRINGQGQIFLTAANTSGADPIISFGGLTLSPIPEPSTIALAGMGLLGLVVLARRRRSA